MKRGLVENITEDDREIFRNSCMMCIQSYWDVERKCWICAYYSQVVSEYSTCCKCWSRLDAIENNVLRF